MTKRWWIGAAAVGALLLLLVAGNLIYSAVNSTGLNRWPDADLGADEVVAFKDTPTRPLHLHLFQPAGVTAAPVVVLFHGGGLVQTRINQFVHQAKVLSDAGIAVAIAEHRVRDDGGTPATSISDAIDAVAWLRTNGSEHALDPRFVAAGGASSGGWLAAETALVNDPPDALVLFNPAVSSASAPAAAVPTIVFHGDSDQIVPLSSAQGYCDASSTCELDVWPGGDHGFFNEDVDEAAFDHTMMQTIEFLSALPND